MKLNVNGKIYSIDCDPDSSLLDVIREKLRLTGTKRGCDIGVCGTCTVLID
ncbi:MAG TPA: 2Fe-2S iron-sulfur cluster-binding protein, partial [Thermotogota bacterium]|nr:2Fe-2S iron-sulfur cluster-binding protein [Thermotogota bacterium]